MTITGTLQHFAGVAVQGALVASELSAGTIPSSSVLNDPNNPSLVAVLLLNRANSFGDIIGGPVLRLGYATGTADTAFPSRVTVTADTYSVDSSNGPKNLTTRALGRQADFTLTEDPSNAIAIEAGGVEVTGRFSAGDTITVELYD